VWGCPKVLCVCVGTLSPSRRTKGPTDPDNCRGIAWESFFSQRLQLFGAVSKPHGQLWNGATTTATTATSNLSPTTPSCFVSKQRTHTATTRSRSHCKEQRTRNQKQELPTGIGADSGFGRDARREWSVRRFPAWLPLTFHTFQLFLHWKKRFG